MMVVLRRQEKIIHSLFKEFPEYLKKEDILVLNNTKVIPARAWGKKEEKQIEFLFLKEKEKGFWEVLCRPARKIKLGDRISFSSGFEGRVTECGAEGKRIIQFSSRDVLSRLKKIGFAPLPPYIKRKKDDFSLRVFDLERYQTVFARERGAIAAPTAGLHFTPQILEKIIKKGVHICPIALEVGLATFEPLRVRQVEDHQMLEERYSIPKATAQAINQAKKYSRPVVAVGTTVVRGLESSFKEGRISSGTASTRLFIYPGYKFNVVDRLLTNFHLPQSTLLMLVSAFAGLDLIKKAYREAIRKKYRFYSYGDCMLIL